MSKHDPHGLGAAYIYLGENVLRTLRHLIGPKDWAERIHSACLDAHRQGDGPHYNRCMSDRTLLALRSTVPTKPALAYDEEELRELADSLLSYNFFRLR